MNPIKLGADYRGDRQCFYFMGTLVETKWRFTWLHPRIGWFP